MYLLAGITSLSPTLPTMSESLSVPSIHTWLRTLATPPYGKSNRILLIPGKLPTMLLTTGLLCGSIQLWMDLCQYFGQCRLQDILQICCKLFRSSSTLINGIGSLTIQPYRGQNRSAAWRIYGCAVHCMLIWFWSCIMSFHICIDTAFIQKHQFIYVFLRYMFFP